MAKIKFIVDESVDFPVVAYLREKGFDTSSVAENSPSLEDAEILKTAFKENRILITNDKDFGNLVFKENSKSKGIMLLRLWDQTSKAKVQILEKVLKEYGDRLSGSFVVVAENKLRIRKL